MLGPLILPKIPWRYGYARSYHALLCRVLEAHRPDAFRSGTDPDQTRIHHRLCEVGVFRQKTVPGMDRFRPRLLSGRNDFFADQVALARWRGPNMHCLVGLTHVKRVFVCVGIYCDGTYTH